MTTLTRATRPFERGDHVHLATGSYQGTRGTFISVRSDPKWADILEEDSTVRAHPLEWLALSPIAPKA